MADLIQTSKVIKKESDKFSESLIFEGMTSISAILNSGSFNNRKIEKILYDKSKEKSKSDKLSYLRHRSAELGFLMEAVSADTIDAMTVGNSHGGIIAICGDRTIPYIDINKIKKHGFYVMLEGIEDPYNFGYALRSLYAAGVDGVILSKRNWMSAAGVVCRASAGASEALEMFIDNDANSAQLFKSIGYKVVCADIRNSISFYDADMTYPVFLVIGGEKRGISSAMISNADQIVRIDYASGFKGSLSAASSAAIIGFEIMRQNKL